MASVSLPEPNGTPNLNYDAAWTFLVVSTNAMITALISFYLVTSRRSISKMLQHSQHGFGSGGKRDHHLEDYTGVVAILIESVLPLTVVGLVYAALAVAQPVKETTQAYIAYDVTLNVFGYLFLAFSVSLVVFKYVAYRLLTTGLALGPFTAYDYLSSDHRSVLGSKASDPWK